ncbi:MAG: DUF503 domain-containing protein [Desulfovibrionaceae bacterium]
MLVGILRLEFWLHGNDSLKGKRRVALSLKQKLRNKFNLSVAEIEAQDSHTRLVLGAAMAGSDWVNIERKLQNAVSMIEAISPEELVDSDIDIIGTD